MFKERCCNCNEEFVDDINHVCAECGLILCESCWSNNGGMCDACWDKHYQD